MKDVVKKMVDDFMQHRINGKREARIVDRFETQNVWECVSCGELYEDLDIVIGPEKNVSKCSVCEGREWKITRMVRPVRRIIWKNTK